jgi:L-iditol 2-dehydrogenase
VVGWAYAFDGLMERVVTDEDQVAPYDPALTPMQAVGLQPLACLLYAVGQLPDVDGHSVGIIGQDALGLLFSYVAKAAGARHITGVDPIDRADVAKAFGGTVFYFGLPDDDSYPISMRTMLSSDLTLKSRVTLERRRALVLANKFAAEHPRLLPTYLTHTFGIDNVQAVFELACRPVPGWVRIAITESGPV